jgi:RNA polymerase sigma factor (sigma-70 family)
MTDRFLRISKLFFARFSLNASNTCWSGFNMLICPPTRVSLLKRIRNREDQQAWQEFVNLYAPVIRSFARSHLLQEDDANDVLQEVLIAVHGGTYKRRRGRFRNWLFTVTINKIRDFYIRRGRQVPAIGGRGVKDLPVKEEWDRKYKQRMFDRAAETVRDNSDPAHWQAFWLTAVEGKTGKEAAKASGLTLSNVYSAKSRVMEKIRAIVKQLQEE